MDPTPFLRGLTVGFAVAAPIGPMSLLCLRRTLREGFAAGMLSGLGVATADAAYGGVAAFGLVAITNLLVGRQVWLRLLGGAALAYVGMRTLRTPPAEVPATAGGTGMAGMYVTTLGLTLANPATILSFAALFAGLSPGQGRGHSGEAAPMVLGLFLGSALWWLILTGGIALVRRRLPRRALRTANVVSGLALLSSSAAVLAGLVLHL